MLHKLYNFFTFIFLPVSIFMTGIKIGKLNSAKNQAIATAMDWEVNTTGPLLTMLFLIVLFIGLLLLREWWKKH